MIVISDNGSLIDENKILSIIQHDSRSIEIVLDNGHEFYKLNMYYPDEKTKNRYLEKLREKLCPEDK